MYWHAGGSPHMCGFCNRWFNTENQLAYHEKQHMRETFECEECGRKFHDEDNLNFHRLVHRGELIFLAHQSRRLGMSLKDGT